MDRFKYRVWAKPHEPTKTEGYYVDDADYMVMTPEGNVQIEYYCDDGYAGYIDSFGQNEIIIEQCTGLKDKNGKLIYENDLIKIDDDIAVIKWSEYYARFMLESKEDNFDFETTYAEECEIIGNIHENADLLGEDND